MVVLKNAINSPAINQFTIHKISENVTNVSENSKICNDFFRQETVLFSDLNQSVTQTTYKITWTMTDYQK